MAALYFAKFVGLTALKDWNNLDVVPFEAVDVSPFFNCSSWNHSQTYQSQSSGNMWIQFVSNVSWSTFVILMIGMKVIVLVIDLDRWRCWSFESGLLFKFINEGKFIQVIWKRSILKRPKTSISVKINNAKNWILKTTIQI